MQYLLCQACVGLGGVCKCSHTSYHATEDTEGDGIGDKTRILLNIDINPFKIYIEFSSKT